MVLPEYAQNTIDTIRPRTNMNRVRPPHEESALLSFSPPLDRGLLFLLADRGRIGDGGLIASQPATEHMQR